MDHEVVDLAASSLLKLYHSPSAYIPYPTLSSKTPNSTFSLLTGPHYIRLFAELAFATLLGLMPATNEDFHMTLLEARLATTFNYDISLDQRRPSIPVEPIACCSPNFQRRAQKQWTPCSPLKMPEA